MASPVRALLCCVNSFEFIAAYAPFQPTVTSLALALAPCLTNPAADLSSVWPLPTGLALQRTPQGAQIQLKAEPFFASKLRRLFGYVGEITLTGGEGADTPAQLQVITRAPWKFGRTAAEPGRSWIFALVQAFAPKAVFSSGAKVVKLGSRISGFAEPSSGTAKSCQLVGWDTCSLGEWRASATQAIPVSFDLAFNRA